MKLTIDFEGLCALVRPAPGARSDGTVQVILVDALKAKEPLCEHKPRLLVDLDDTDSRPGDIVGLPDGQQLGVWDLHQKDVRIVTGTPPGDRVISSRETRKKKPGQDVWEDETPRYGETWNDISWVPEMSRIIGDGNIDPVCLSAKPGPIVAARITLDEGLLESVVEGAWEGNVWEFEPYKKRRQPTYRQVVAERFRLKLASKAGLTVLLQKFGSKPHGAGAEGASASRRARTNGHGDHGNGHHKDDGEQESEIRLKTQRREEIRIAISNLPSKREGVHYDPRKKRVIVDHFRAYYDLSEAGKKIAWNDRPVLFLPVRSSGAMSRVQPRGPEGAKPVLCVPADYTKPPA